MTDLGIRKSTDRIEYTGNIVLKYEKEQADIYITQPEFSEIHRERQPVDEHQQDHIEYTAEKRSQDRHIEPLKDLGLHNEPCREQIADHAFCTAVHGLHVEKDSEYLA